VGLERGPLSLASTIEELLEKKIAGLSLVIYYRRLTGESVKNSMKLLKSEILNIYGGGIILGKAACTNIRGKRAGS
jgi:hypothetical protein